MPEVRQGCPGRYLLLHLRASSLTGPAGRLRCALVGLAFLVLATGAFASPAGLDDVGPGDYLDRGLKLYRAGDLPGATRALRRAVGFDPRLVPAHYTLAKVHLIEREPYKAFYALREVLAIEPGNTKARRLLAELTPDLLARVQSDIKTRRNVAMAYNVMGFLLISQNRLGEGVRREEYALKLDPKMAEAYDDLAWAAYKDRDLERAFDLASKAFELDPTKGSIASHYQQLFNLKRLGVPFPAADRALPGTATAMSVDPERSPRDPSESPIVSDASSGPSLGSGGNVGAIRPIRDSDLERMVGEDDRLVQDYLKTAQQLSAAPQKRPSFLPPASPGASPSPSTSPSPTGHASPAPGDERRRQIAAETQKALKQKYDLAVQKENKKAFREALEIYGVIYGTDRAFADVAERIVVIKRLLDTVYNYDDAIQAIRRRQFEVALLILRDLDRRDLLRARGIESIDDLVGEAHYGARQFDAAKVSLERYVKGHPESSRARYLFARSLYALGQYAETYEQIQVLVEKDPNFYAANPELATIRTKAWVKSHFGILLAMTLLWMGLSSGFVFRKYKKGSRSRLMRKLIERVQTALKKEKWADVLKETEKFAGLQLSRAEEVFIGCAAGTALLQAGDILKAQKLQRELLEAFPDEPSVQHLTARLLLTLKDYSEEAVAMYQNLLAVEPNNRKLLEALNTYYQARAPESEEAMKILDRLLELDPTSPDFRYHRAVRFLRQKDFSEPARLAYVRVLEVDPGRSDVRFGLARCHFESRNYLEAIKEIKKALETDVRSADLHKILITSYLRLSMRAEAVREYRQMIARNPEVDELKTYLRQLEDVREEGFADEQVSREAEALFEKGVKLYHEGKHRDAIAGLTAAFNTDHLRLSAGTLLVRSYLKLRETKTALTIFERLDVLTQKTPDDFVLGLCYDVADVYVKEGRRDRAIELYTFICTVNVSYRDAFTRLENLQQSGHRA